MLSDPCQETPLAGERDPRALDAQSFLPLRRACVLRGIVLILMLLIPIYIIHCFSIQIFYQTIPSTRGRYSRPLLFCHFQLLCNWHANGLETFLEEGGNGFDLASSACNIYRYTEGGPIFTHQSIHSHNGGPLFLYDPDAIN
jgi:hypothetical protein